LISNLFINKYENISKQILLNNQFDFHAIKWLKEDFSTHLENTKEEYFLCIHLGVFIFVDK